jgi:two-component sensor histidine kinase/FixJ family two-component response regulator
LSSATPQPMETDALAPRETNPPKAKILIVDDDKRTAHALEKALEELDQTLIVTNSAEDALYRLLREDFALILLDVNMPGMGGYEMASFVRARKRTRHIPIVFLTALLHDDAHLLQAYSSGAVDMVFKPIDPFILRSKVSVFVDLYLKQVEMQHEMELRHKLEDENIRVLGEKRMAEEALRRSREHQEAMERAEAHQRILIEELNHRVKNMLTVVSAMARQTIADNPAPEVFSEKFIKRIDSLARTYALLTREQWGHIQLLEVVRENLEPHTAADESRLSCSGPRISLAPRMALALGIVFHELATNALKHGSLSRPEGLVTIAWELDKSDASRIGLRWEESAGPPVQPPTRTGFGSRLIKLEVTHELSGEIEFDYAPGGLRVLMNFSLDASSTIPTEEKETP